MVGDLRDRFAIVGAGLTPTAQTHARGMSPLMLETWAAKLAIEDAGLQRQDVDGAIHAMMGSPHAPAQWLDAYSRTLGIPAAFYLNIAKGGHAAHNGILLATQVLRLGLAKYVLVTCGLPGWSAAHPEEGLPSLIGLPHANGTDLGLGLPGWDAAASAASVHGLYATRHMHEYGTTERQLGAVAIAAREWACLNPEARFYGRPATIEDYLESPYMAWPLRRMDCCVQSDLGASLIVTTAERARTLRKPAVYIKGLGLGDQARSQWWEKSHYTQVDAAHAKSQALNEAQISLEDVDVAEMYDCFTTEIIFYMEDYGWCQKGEGGAFVESGTIAPGGSLPVNTHGGLLSGMYLFDFPGVLEAVAQLRGEAGDRQVADAEIALTNGHGGEMVQPGMCSSHATMILGRTPS
jgi:acetyl-CoA acetyltransferase